MIVVDTSVWVDFFRNSNRKLVKILWDLLDQDQVALAVPIRIEILSGSAKKQQHLLRRVLAALPIFYPTQKTWGMVEQWIESGLSKGHRFGALDLMIGAMTQEYACILWSLDKDFDRMGELGWIQLFDAK